MKYLYYYNNVPGVGPCRNNLIYTSLINEDETEFVQWYHNDEVYHQGRNEVVDPRLMESKWKREVEMINHMKDSYPELVPNILNIDYQNKKLHLEIDGPDFWELSGCNRSNFDRVLPDWQDQMLNIISAHKSIGMYKYSMHPSSYFIVQGKLRSINYFFAYLKEEGSISISDHASHIYSSRQKELRKFTESNNIEWDTPQPLELMNRVCWESFRNTYPSDFIEKALKV